MTAYVASEDREEVAAASLIRLLRSCPEDGKWPALIQATRDPSPLVRAAAAESLVGNGSEDALHALVRAAGDDYRLVRVRAAAALAGAPLRSLASEDRAVVQRATGELLASMKTRPDDDTAHTNLGNFYMNNGDLRTAIQSFETAEKLNPRNVITLVNLSLAYNLNAENGKAEKSLRKALEADPGNAAANFNLGLLLGEMGRKDEASEALRRALKTDPEMAAAAYNLCVIEAEKSVESAIRWCRVAAEKRPREPKYGYTLGFYEAQRGNPAEAVQVLEDVITRHPAFMDAYGLLIHVYQSLGDGAAVASVQQRAARAAH